MWFFSVFFFCEVPVWLRRDRKLPSASPPFPTVVCRPTAWFYRSFWLLNIDVQNRKKISLRVLLRVTLPPKPSTLRDTTLLPKSIVQSRKVTRNLLRSVLACHNRSSSGSAAFGKLSMAPGKNSNALYLPKLQPFPPIGRLGRLRGREREAKAFQEPVREVVSVPCRLLVTRLEGVLERERVYI
jgi:hypothetical protein